MKCRLCAREAVTDLCRYHHESRGKVESSYALWTLAYGKISLKEYLDRIIKNSETGQWAKEAAELLVGELSDKEHT